MSPAAGRLDRLRRLGRFDALVVTALLWFLGKFVRYAFPPLFERFAGVYDVSTAVLGTAFTGFMLVYAAMQFPSGLLADRFGSVSVIAGGAVLAAGGALALAVDGPFLVLVGAMLVMGGGTGTLKTVAVRLLSRAYPTRTGRSLGVFDTFGAFGGVAAPAAVVFFAGVPGVFGAGWRTTFLVAGLVGLGLAAVFAVRVPARLSEESGLRSGRSDDSAADGDQTGDSTDGDSTGDDPVGGVSLRAYAALFREWRFAAFVGVTVLFSFAYNGAVAFLPLYLTTEATLSPATASFVFSALFVVSLVQLVTGEASDRVGTLPVIVVTLGLAASGLVGVLLLTGVGGPLVLGGAVVCLGLGAHGFRPVRGAYLVSVVPDAVAGGSLGVVRTLLMGAGALAPALVGVISETAGFGPAFWLLAGALLAATALAGTLWVVD